jgi:hypothetical protein
LQSRWANRHDKNTNHATLGTWGVAFFVISAAAPLTAMAGGAPVAMLLGNGAGPHCSQPLAIIASDRLARHQRHHWYLARAYQP